MQDGKLVVEFAVGKADNPKVNAIVLVKGGVESTHYTSHYRYLMELDKIHAERWQEQQKQLQKAEQTPAVAVEFDYFEEDPRSKPSLFNEIAKTQFVVEGISIAAVVAFFAIQGKLKNPITDKTKTQ